MSTLTVTSPYPSRDLPRNCRWLTLHCECCGDYLCAIGIDDPDPKRCHLCARAVVLRQFSYGFTRDTFPVVRPLRSNFAQSLYETKQPKRRRGGRPRTSV